MRRSRRGILGSAGRMALVLTVTAAGGRLVRAEDDLSGVRAAGGLEGARAPWGAAPANAHPDPRVRALAYAILAPSPHNRQPWTVELVGDDAMVVRCDLARRLPETDPFDRQVTIGFGCFLELLRMAAAADGFAAQTTPFPDGTGGARLDERPVASLRLVPAVPDREPLFASALARRSYKSAFDPDRPVDPELLPALRAAALAPERVAASADPALVARVRELTVAAFEVEAGTPRTHLESVRLMRIGGAEIEADPDGIALGGPVIERLAAEGVLTRATLADAGSPAHAQMRGFQRAVVESAEAHLWLSTPGNTRVDQLEAGRDWLRLNLKATELGLRFGALSQALQEFPEMEGLNRRLHALLGIPGDARLQMLVRLGHGPEVPPAPRRPAEAALRRG